jgi:hypothetical protein
MLPTDYLTRIGNVVTKFELLQRNLGSVLTGFISPNPFVGIIVTREVGFWELVRLIKAIYMQLHGEDDDFAQLKTILEEAKRVKALRDKIVHSGFTHVSDPEKKIDHIGRFKVTAKERRGYQRHSEKITLADLDGVVGEIGRINDDLLDWSIRLIKLGKTPYIQMAKPDNSANKNPRRDSH